MSSYQEAKDAGFEAYNLVESFGAAVCTVRPVETSDGWKIEVETARPLPESVDRNILVNGVPVVFTDRGLPPVDDVRAHYRARLKLRTNR